MSRFQRVTLVHAVSRTSGVRCSPSPDMKREGREVEICRNWSAKKRGATVVFSLPERKGGSGQQPRQCPAAGRWGTGLEDPQPWQGGHGCLSPCKQNQVSAELRDSCFPSQPLNRRGGQSKAPAAADGRPAAITSVPRHVPAPTLCTAGAGVRSRFQTESLREGAGSLAPARALTAPARRAAGRRRGRRGPG